jgi:hypothetical protein
MFKNIKPILTGIVVAVTVIVIGTSACTAVVNTPAAGTTTSNGNTSGSAVLDATAAAVLSSGESASLLFMREEEKLARDVYNALAVTWGDQIFTNIASSEQTHMDQLKVLIDRYGLTDTALTPGQFTNTDLQTLYDQLIDQGNLSIADAYKVSAAIDEIDILDLQTRFSQTDKGDIQLVYNQLMNGSFNHLSAFTSSLAQQTGETYQPQYLSAEVYQTILATTGGNGNQAATGAQGSNTQANGTQTANGQQGTTSQGSGTTTVHGVINSLDLTGMNITLDDGTLLYVQLGKSTYNQSIGFTPAAGEELTITGFPGDQALYSAMTITVDSTAQIYSFRDATGAPLWTTGNGNGNGQGGG